MPAVNCYEFISTKSPEEVHIAGRDSIGRSIGNASISHKLMMSIFCTFDNM